MSFVEHAAPAGQRAVAHDPAGLEPSWRPQRADLVNAAVVLGIGLVLIALNGSGTGDLPRLVEPASPWWHVIPLVLVCLAIAFQSARPMTAFGIASLLLVADALMGLNLALVLAWSNPVYAVYRHAAARQRRGVTIGIVAALGAVIPFAFAAGASVGDAVLISAQLGAFAAIAAWWGGDVRSGHELAAVERARAADIAKLADLERAQAVRTERAGMARDLHDVIASHLSAIAIHSTAALQLDPDAVRDRRALGEAREQSVAALDEMRRLIQLLRAEGDDEPLALGGADDLGDVVERFRRAGLETDAHLDPAGIETVPGRALLLIAREALTNALKHGAGSARLRLALEGDDATLVVENPMPRADASRASVSAATDRGVPDDGALGTSVGHDERDARGWGGLGLGTMRERAVSLGGTLMAGPVQGDDGCTWAVEARIPNTTDRREAP